MGIVLFAWELGNNMGHIARDFPVALELRARGHAVYFACRNLAQAKKVLEPQGFSCVQAPRFTLPRPRFTPSSYAEILLANGYDNEVATKLLVAAWQRLLTEMKADVVVCNHAPSAIFASRCANIPAVATCIGFELPPAASQVLRIWDPPPMERIIESEQLVCRNISRELAKGGHQGIESIRQLFSDASVLMTTFPELDHYGPREGLEYVGPVSYLPGCEAEWSQTGRKRVFAYLRSTVPNITAILDGLRASSFQTLCVMPDRVPDRNEEGADSHFRIRPDMVNIASCLEVCSLVVTYGTGTIHDALLAGRPLLMCPQNAEQFMVALQVVRIGAGLLLPVEVSASAIADIATVLLTDESFSKAAARFSRKYASFSTQSAVRRIVQTIECRF